MTTLFGNSIEAFKKQFLGKGKKSNPLAQKCLDEGREILKQNCNPTIIINCKNNFYKELLSSIINFSNENSLHVSVVGGVNVVNIVVTEK